MIRDGRSTTLFALVLVLTLLSPYLALRAHAQAETPITIEAQAGFGGVYRIGHWFPVTLVLTNDGPDRQLDVNLRVSEAIYREVVDLPRGAQKAVTIMVQTNEFVRTITVALRDDQGELLRQQVRIEPIDVSQVLVGVIDSDPTLLNSLAGMQFPESSGVTVAHFTEADLSARAAILDGFDMLFLRSLATELDPSLVEAVATWVQFGGQLVVSGGVDGERAQRAFADLLPLTVGPLQAGADFSSLERLARRDGLIELVTNPAAHAVELGPNAQPLDIDGLLVQRELGAGRLIFSRFDLAALRAWPGEAELWQQVITPQARLDIGFNYQWRSDNLLRTGLSISDLSLPSFWLIAILILGYIVLIGPVNFFVLRRLNRLDLAWLTIPVIVVFALLSSYGAALLGRGTRAQTFELGLIQGFEGQATGRQTSFIGVFSPNRSNYELSTDPTNLIAAATLDGFRRDPLVVETGEGLAGVPRLLVDVGALRTLLIERDGAPVPPVESQLGQVEVELRYNGASTLEDAVLVINGDTMAVLGRLAPGQTVTVSRQANQLIPFPGAYSASVDPTIDRVRVVNDLFGFDRFSFGTIQFNGTSGVPDRNGIYLLGWQSEPTTDLRLNGSVPTRRGSSLYIIRLDGQEGS